MSNAKFCFECGAAVGSASPSSASNSTASGSLFTNQSEFPQTPRPELASPGFDVAEDSALSRLRFAAILGIVGFALTVLVAAATPTVAYINEFTAGPTSNANGFSVGVLLFLTVVAAFVVLLQIGMFYQAFQRLAPYDPRFSVPQRLAVIAIVGLVILLLASSAFFYVIYQANICWAGNSGVGCLNQAAADATVGAMLIAGGLALVGYVGLAVGVWRLADHYSEGLFKPAAILLLLLTIVGSFLLLLATRSVRRKSEAFTASVSAA